MIKRTEGVKNKDSKTIIYNAHRDKEISEAPYEITYAIDYHYGEQYYN